MTQNDVQNDLSELELELTDVTLADLKSLILEKLGELREQDRREQEENCQ